MDTSFLNSHGPVTAPHYRSDANESRYASPWLPSPGPPVSRFTTSVEQPSREARAKHQQKQQSSPHSEDTTQQIDALNSEQVSPSNAQSQANTRDPLESPKHPLSLDFAMMEGARMVISDDVRMQCPDSSPISSAYTNTCVQGLTNDAQWHSPLLMSNAFKATSLQGLTNQRGCNPFSNTGTSSGLLMGDGHNLDSAAVLDAMFKDSNFETLGKDPFWADSTALGSGLKTSRTSHAVQDLNQPVWLEIGAPAPNALPRIPTDHGHASLESIFIEHTDSGALARAKYATLLPTTFGFPSSAPSQGRTGLALPSKRGQQSIHALNATGNVSDELLMDTGCNVQSVYDPLLCSGSNQQSQETDQQSHRLKLREMRAYLAPPRGEQNPIRTDLCNMGPSAAVSLAHNPAARTSQDEYTIVHGISESHHAMHAGSTNLRQPHTYAGERIGRGSSTEKKEEDLVRSHSMVCFEAERDVCWPMGTRGSVPDSLTAPATPVSCEGDSAVVTPRQTSSSSHNGPSSSLNCCPPCSGDANRKGRAFALCTGFLDVVLDRMNYLIG